MRFMNKFNFSHIGLLLVLVTACQTKHVPVPADNAATIKAGNALKTEAQTGASTKVARERNVTHIQVKITGEDSLQYTIAPDTFEAKPSQYVLELQQIGESVQSNKLAIKQDNPLFAEIDALFLGKVQISEAPGADDPEKPTENTVMTVFVFSGSDQKYTMPVLAGEKAEDLLAEIRDFAFKNMNVDEAKAQILESLQYTKIDVNVAGGGSRHYMLQPSKTKANAFTLSLIADNFKPVNVDYEVLDTAGAAYRAIVDLMSGKLVLKNYEPTDPNASMGSWTTVSLTAVKGEVIAIKDPQATDAKGAGSALRSISEYIDLRRAETSSNVVIRPAVSARSVENTCANLDLSGSWKSVLVGDQEILNVTSVMTKTATNSDGSVDYSSADVTLVSSCSGTKRCEVTNTFRYHPDTCIIEKSDKKIPYKVIYIGGQSKTVIKVAPCADAACSEVDAHPAYTEMTVLRRK